MVASSRARVGRDARTGTAVSGRQVWSGRHSGRVGIAGGWFAFAGHSRDVLDGVALVPVVRSDVDVTLVVGGEVDAPSGPRLIARSRPSTRTARRQPGRRSWSWWRMGPGSQGPGALEVRRLGLPGVAAAPADRAGACRGRSPHGRARSRCRSGRPDRISRWRGHRDHPATRRQDRPATLRPDARPGTT